MLKSRPPDGSGLALAAVGFSFRVWRWLSRLALALPVLQLLLSLLRPDSQEALALRLQQVAAGIAAVPVVAASFLSLPRTRHPRLVVCSDPLLTDTDHES